MLMPPESIEDTEKVLGMIRKGQKVDHYQTKRRRKDGTIIDVSLTVSPIRNDEGDIVGASKVGRDITEQRRAEELREQLAAIVESSDDIIASKDLDGVITSWNKGAERVLGYTAEEVIGRHVSMLMPPELVEDMPKILGRIRRGEKVDHYETRRRRKDGTIIDVSLTVSPIRDASGRVIGASKIGRDITQEKLIEAERREADRRKDEFLAMLAHELQEPALGHQQRGPALREARDRGGPRLGEGRRAAAGEAPLAADRRPPGRLPHLSRQDRPPEGTAEPLAGRQHRRRGRPPAPGGAEARAERLAHQRGPEARGRPLEARADPREPPDQRREVHRRRGPIALTARHEGTDIVIRVRDTGMGISPELMPRIFDLFAQGDRTMARSEGGLGIGLTLVQKLAEMHGGTVTAASEGPGKGSEFTVRLPALEEPAARKPGPRGTLPRVARQSSRVLVVDDNLDTARGLSRLLKLLGHDVRMAHDGKDAIEAARAHRPEIVLLDIGLPGMDGYEVVRQLRTEACCRDSLIIAVSGYGQPEDLRRSKEAGFDHHLTKPVDYDALMTLFAVRSN